MNNGQENIITKVLKKIKKYLSVGFLSLVLFMVTIVAVALPVLWIGSVIGGLFSDIGDLFGSNNTSTGDGTFATSVDVWVYENRVSLDYVDLMGCTLVLEDNYENCLDLILEDGTINSTNLEYDDAGELFSMFVDSTVEEYYGTFDNSIRGTTTIPTYYQIGYYKTNSDGDEELIVGSTIYTNNSGTGCLNLSDDDVCVIYNGYTGATVSSSNAPSTSELVSNYGFQISDDGLSASYNYYQEIGAGGVYAMAGGKITSMSDKKIVLEVTVGNYDFTITYEGDFNNTYYPNDISGLPIDSDTVFPQDLIAYTSSSFKVYVQYEEKYVNPAILYDVVDGWSEITSATNYAGTSVNGYTDVSGVVTGQRAYITTQVAFDVELWADVEFQLPFNKIVISQCPELIGWGDGGNNHTALDFYNADASGYQEVGSAIAGVVVESGYNSISGYFVTVQHESGVRVNYNHLVYRNSSGKTLSQPQVGDTVALGEIIGFMGDSGNVTGIHIHMNVYQPINDEKTLYGWINPMWLLDESEYTYLSGVSACVVSK